MDQIDINITRYVYHIKSQNSIGTAFYYYTNNNNYLITAKHVIENNTSNVFEYKTNKEWIEFSGEIILPTNKNIDIAAIKINSELPFKKSYYVDFNGFENYTSEEVYFLGYPYGITSVENEPIEQSICLVKKSIISGVLIENGIEIGYYLDGHNNPGFSGGPCVYKRPDAKWHIFAVVSSYYNHTEVLYDDKGNKRMILYENSGLFMVHKISFIIDAIRSQDSKLTT